MKIEITGVNTKISKRQKNYIRKKIDNLEKYLPLAQRGIASAEIKIEEVWVKQLKRLDSEVVLKLPRRTLMVRESSGSALAAIDAAEDKLKLIIKKYKDKSASPKLHQKLIARYRRRGFAV